MGGIRITGVLQIVKAEWPKKIILGVANKKGDIGGTVLIELDEQATLDLYRRLGTPAELAKKGVNAVNGKEVNILINLS